MKRREVVCLVGPTGVGKSHLAQALGHRACMAGRTVLYVSAHQMLDELHAARADQSWDRRMLRFVSPVVLIIDDLGLRPLRQDEPQDLFEVIRRRYERGGMAINSNREVKEWYPLFGDPLLAGAAMDRLLHHALVIEMDGASYRNPPLDKVRPQGGRQPGGHPCRVAQKVPPRGSYGRHRAHGQPRQWSRRCPRPPGLPTVPWTTLATLVPGTFACRGLPTPPQRCGDD